MIQYFIVLNTFKNTTQLKEKQIMKYLYMVVLERKDVKKLKRKEKPVKPLYVISDNLVNAASHLSIYVDKYHIKSIEEMYEIQDAFKPGLGIH